MKTLKPIAFLIIVLCISPVSIGAQMATCPQIVESAFAAVDQFCRETGRNQACYGNILLDAEPQADVDEFHFSDVGDIVDVSLLHRLTLSPMNIEAGAWGVAMLRLQANLPDTLPGQNVTFLLFGDVEIESAVPSEGSSYRPMQAFYLRTGIGDAACEEAPESGMLVQTPDGVNEVTFNVNGVDVEMGSTVFFQSSGDEEMVVNTLEGAAYLRQGDEVQVAVAGTRIRVRLRLQQLADMPAAAAPPPGITELPEEPALELGEAYDLSRLKGLPLKLLERKIDLALPLADDLREQALERLKEGQPLCGEPPFPPCRERSHRPLRGNR